MLKLHGKIQEIKFDRKEAQGNGRSTVVLLSTNVDLPDSLKSDRGFIVKDNVIPIGFKYYFLFESSEIGLDSFSNNAILLSDDYRYLDDGDVVSISNVGNQIKSLYRKNSRHNAILVTEQCNHFCLMCSQPPKEIDDSWLLTEIKETIPLMSRTTTEVIFTGGEPTTYRDEFLEILRLTKSYLPSTSIHILSNGRSFSDLNYAYKYSLINHDDMMVGIPVYADDPSLHDYIVQSKGAFDQTIQGIINLKRFSQKVEIRVVIHKLNIERLVNLCEFITRNLLFVDHVALMGLEMTGFTRLNLSDLWIDSYEYKDILSDAVNMLSTYGMNVSVYNHQLCLVNNDVIPFYKKSISDWKNEYVAECDGCSKKDQCGGFFSSSVKYKYSQKIYAL
jgi:His-Xaa-Ser system radical SAM maturase HxsC